VVGQPGETGTFLAPTLILERPDKLSAWPRYVWIMPLPTFTLIGPGLIQISFDHPEWLFELKYDGFRALAYIENGECRLISRTQRTYTRFAELRAAMPGDIKATDAILDGEIVAFSGYQTGSPAKREARSAGRSLSRTRHLAAVTNHRRHGWPCWNKLLGRDQS
jgi:hypothetical protein